MYFNSFNNTKKILIWHFSFYKFNYIVPFRSDPQKYAAKIKEIENKEKEKLQQMKKDLSPPPKIDKEALDGDGDDEKFSGSWPPKVEFCHRLNICGHNSI